MELVGRTTLRARDLPILVLIHWIPVVRQLEFLIEVEVAAELDASPAAVASVKSVGSGMLEPVAASLCSRPRPSTHWSPPLRRQ